MDFNNIYNYITNYDKLDKAKKIRNILIILVVVVVSIPSEIMYLKYIDKTYGDSYSKLIFAYNMFLFLALMITIGISIAKPSQPKDDNLFTALAALFAAGAIIGLKLYFIRSQIKSFEEQALSNSYYTTGVITKKDLSSGPHSGTTYYLWIGQNDSLAKKHSVNEQLYKRKNVGDTVILQVSTESTRINEVFIWEPSGYEIARYRDENNK